jgi:hypothetical protein
LLAAVQLSIQVFARVLRETESCRCLVRFHSFPSLGGVTRSHKVRDGESVCSCIASFRTTAYIGQHVYPISSPAAACIW